MIEVNYHKLEQRSVAFDKGTEIGECTYSVEDNMWVINHTFVDSQHGGRGIAKQLVELLVHEARQAGVTVRATCSYAVRLFAKTSDYDDVVIKS